MGQSALKWLAAEAKAVATRGTCQTTGDQAPIQGVIDSCTTNVATALAGGGLSNCPADLATCDANLIACQVAQPQQFPATGQATCWDSSGAVIACAGTGHDGEIQAGATLTYTDNGDGTITDNNTKLTWEKLSQDGSVHDWSPLIGWDFAFATKVAALNSANFAGHNDWRVPNPKELQSIVDYEIHPGPTVAAAFNNNCTSGCTVTTCSCTQSSAYWSSSTYAVRPNFAVTVSFYDGAVGGWPKTNSGLVRAVRGGP